MEQVHEPARGEGADAKARAVAYTQRESSLTSYVSREFGASCPHGAAPSVEGMRTLLVSALLAGCISTTESHGVTARQYAGTVPVVFINATPERLCGLYLSYDNEPEYGDNWLPVDGLPVGQSLELQVKDGTYKAKWNTCKDVRDVGSVNYSATLVAGTAFPITEPLQLYAFVSDGTPPTKRAVPRPRLKLVKFIGQTTELTAAAEPR